MSNKIKYLGDGVYIRSDGYHWIIQTSDGVAPTNEIFLDPHVLAAFIKEVTKQEFPQSAEEADAHSCYDNSECGLVK